MAQPLVVPGDVAGNVAGQKPLVAEAAQRGARLVVFSECGLTGYDLKGVGARAALPKDAAALDEVGRLAREHRVGIVAGFHEKDGDKVYSAAAVFLPDGRRVLRRKQRVLAPEKATGPVVPGPRERTVLEIDGVRCGLLVCAEAGIPGVFEDLAGAGCDAVVLITAGAGDESFGFGRAALKDPAVRAKYAKAAAACLSPEGIEQCLKLDLAQVACNQSGRDAATGYFHPGGSSVVDRTGRVTAVIPPTLILELVRAELAVGTVTARGKGAVAPRKTKP